MASLAVSFAATEAPYTAAATAAQTAGEPILAWVHADHAVETSTVVHSPAWLTDVTTRF